MKIYDTNHVNLSKLWEITSAMPIDQARRFYTYFLGALTPLIEPEQWEQILTDTLESFVRYETTRRKLQEQGPTAALDTPRHDTN